MSTLENTHRAAQDRQFCCRRNRTEIFSGYQIETTKRLQKFQIKTLIGENSELMIGTFCEQLNNF